MQKDLRIVFMGTPDFAVPTLANLVDNGYNVVGVVTMPDKAIGRHHDVLQSSPVKQYAVAHNIPVLQPEKLKDEAFLSELRDLKADLQIVVAFRMLPQVVWGMPRLGTFNLHAALLPQYRGAAPINWAIINGDKETGITTFFLDEDIDTGRIILQERMPIGDDDCLEDIHDRMMIQGAALVQKTVDLIAEGKAEATDQTQFMTDEPLRPAPKIFKETCEIEWTSTKKVHDFVRGLSPYPAAWTTLCTQDGKEVIMKVFRTKKEAASHNIAEPTLQTDGKTYLRVALPDGYLYLTEVQISGKKRMSIADFLRGAHTEGWTLCIKK
ncbi:MAG: methionyl-tRNA formyltransferase [Bacteroidaceae bacterium]|nr:methionyl-tRNA formyltransferase [Bacteroidaceae bacterium]